ncbi:hypothetical protein RB595_002905 [Gaeumannomyces hyphopodioides]
MQPPQIPPGDPDYVRATVALVDWDQASVPWSLSPFGRASNKRAYQNAPRMAALNAGRELTPAEVEAFMELSFDMLSAKNVAGTVCTAVPAYYFWRRGMARFSFPLWRPAGRFDPDTLRLPLVPRPLVGARARAAWHGLRFAAYWVAAALMAGGAASAVATAAVANRGTTDPRLEQWRADCMARVSANKPLPGGLPRHPAPLPRQQQQHSGYGGDDGSSWRSDDDGSRTTPVWPTASGAPSPARPEQPRPPRGGGDFDDPFDDGSAVAPSYRGPSSTGAPSSTGPDAGGSAWDRLRRESATRASGQSQQPSRSWDAKRANAAGGGEESWSYSSPGRSEADTDRERAQKEFDEMLERERRSQSGGRS